VLREGTWPDHVRVNMGLANVHVTQIVYGKSWCWCQYENDPGRAGREAAAEIHNRQARNRSALSVPDPRTPRVCFGHELQSG
jgi:hypothetical protein